MLMLQCRNRRFCAGFRTPAALSSPRAPPAGVRKAPRHEIASGGSGPSVPQERGAANGYADLGAGPDSRRSASASWLEQECNLSVPARMLLNGDFTFCPIRNFKGLHRKRRHARQLLRDKLHDELWPHSKGS